MQIKYLLTTFTICLISQLLNSQPATDGSVQWNLNIFDSPIVNVLWCGSKFILTDDNDKIETDDDSNILHLFIITDRGLVYKSRDNGQSW